MVYLKVVIWFQIWNWVLLMIFLLEVLIMCLVSFLIGLQLLYEKFGGMFMVICWLDFSLLIMVSSQVLQMVYFVDLMVQMLNYLWIMLCFLLRCVVFSCLWQYLVFFLVFRYFLLIYLCLVSMSWQLFGLMLGVFIISRLLGVMRCLSGLRLLQIRNLVVIIVFFICYVCLCWVVGIVGGCC